MRLIYFCFLVISVVACDTGIGKKKTERNVYPPLPLTIKNQLLTECDYIDYIFKDLPISASFGPDQGLKMNINFISEASVPNLNNNCLLLGRKTFQHRGEYITEADVYYGQGCMYYIFFVEGKPTYANKMTEDGINFYTNIIGNVQQQQQQ